MRPRVCEEGGSTKGIQILERISTGFTWAGVALLTAATGILFANVVFRYLLAEPFAWAEELTALMQMWFVFLPQAWIEARNEHLFLTVLTSRITHAGTNRILQLARSIGIILVNSYLVYYGTKVVLQG